MLYNDAHSWYHLELFPNFQVRSIDRSHILQDLGMDSQHVKLSLTNKTFTTTLWNPAADLALSQWVIPGMRLQKCGGLRPSFYYHDWLAVRPVPASRMTIYRQHITAGVLFRPPFSFSELDR
jgi:hypothetical protein